MQNQTASTIQAPGAPHPSEAQVAAIVEAAYILDAIRR
jgi:hypothetical protein